MRLDARAPGYDPRIPAAAVLLDGDELHLCVMADEEEGRALVLLEHDGQIDFYDEEGPVLYEVHGQVQIRLRQ